MNQNEVKDKAVELLGEAQPVTLQPKKQTILSFQRGNIYMGLKLVSEYDKSAGRYKEPVPKITLMFDGKYVRMPIDSSLIRDFSRFLGSLAEVVDGVDVRHEEDPEEVNRRIEEFRRACLGPQA